MLRLCRMIRNSTALEPAQTNFFLTLIHPGRYLFQAMGATHTRVSDIVGGSRYRYDRFHAVSETHKNGVKSTLSFWAFYQ